KDFRIWMAAYNPQPDDLVTGGYFYGAEFLIPDHPQVRPYVRFNKKYFTAPEFEDVLHTQPERGQKAQTWLRELMQEARRCGLTIQFSTELNVIDNKSNEELAGRILEDYPLVQVLEFISAEAGDFTSVADAPANAAMAHEIITGTDEAALQKKYVKKSKSKVGQSADPWCPQIRNYANNIRLIRYLQAQQWEKEHNVTLICGSYACRPESIKLEMKLAEEFLPQTTWLAIMPGHSSREVLSNIQEADIKPDLFNRLLINNWIEFDGYMMLQQNTAQGIYELAHYIMGKTGKDNVSGFLCNHWRTAPNATSFRYLGQLSFNSKLDPASYYRQTATGLGLPDSASSVFAQAMSTLDELSDVRAIAGNIGFNLGWGINPAQRDIGNIWWWARKNLEAGRDRFVQALAQLEACRTSSCSPEGQARLDYLINGVNCSIEHLQGVVELKAISDKYYDQTLGKMREDLTPNDETFILQAANRADAHFQRYLTLISRDVRDRGEEGMLVTYYWGPVVYCNNIRATYGKQGKFIKQNEEGDTVPQPYSANDEKSIRR
ncbi:MAG: hypothetical protein WCO84_09075, partial [bacterium]